VSQEIVQAEDQSINQKNQYDYGSIERLIGVITVGLVNSVKIKCWNNNHNYGIRQCPEVSLVRSLVEQKDRPHNIDS